MSRYSSYKKGYSGEEWASGFLEDNFYTILSRNFRCRYGEIDIIALKNDEVSFIEVKTWDGLDSFDLSYVINTEKIKRIVNASTVFLRDYKGSYQTIGFDVLLIKNRRTEIEHYRNISLE